VPPGERPAPSHGRGASPARGGGAVAVCTLGSTDLVPVLSEAVGVGIAGCLRTANLGIEQIVRAVLGRPRLRYLVLCGRDSPLFRQGQSLVALVRHGLDPADRRILGAHGHLPYLPNLDPADVEAFRAQITLLDLREVVDPETVLREVAALCPETAFSESERARLRRELPAPSFVELSATGRRRPIALAGEGFFVISVDRPGHRVVVEHYRSDLRPGHRLSGVRAESLLLGLLGAGLASAADHAGYLGVELAKAETALRLGLNYEQDRPLRRVGPGDGMRSMADRSADRFASSEEFGRFLGEGVGAEQALILEKPLAEQLHVDSLRMMELAVMLEQDLGLTLPDDLDLRQCTPAELYRSYLSGAAR
jgi:acyl carrier protein